MSFNEPTNTESNAEAGVDTSFENARENLREMSDEALKAHFWKLAEELVQPMLDMGREYTSPSIERSIVMRMGFSSIEATSIVSKVIDLGLMGKGAGHIIYRIARENDLSIRDAGVALAEGNYWKQAEELFKGGNHHE